MAKNILVIDDEELIVKTLRKLLEKSGYLVSIAKSGKEALDIVGQKRFDLIVADIRMPGLNGVDTIQSVYDNRDAQHLNKIPTIFITGYADKEMEERAAQLNPVAYIYKPFDASELIDTIRETLKE